MLGEGERWECEGGGVMGGGVEGRLECSGDQIQTVDELIRNPVIGEGVMCGV